MFSAVKRGKYLCAAEKLNKFGSGQRRRRYSCSCSRTGTEHYDNCGCYSLRGHLLFASLLFWIAQLVCKGCSEYRT
eukprot:1612943-Amphidinium_carterae.1